MKRENRNLAKAYSDATAAGATLIDISEPSRADWLENTIPSGLAAFIAFIAGTGLAQFAVDRAFWFFKDADKAYAAVAVGGWLALIFFVAIYVFTVLANGTRYYTEFNKETETPEPAAAAFIRTARDKQRMRLAPGMRPLLVKFAQHYDEVDTMGIEAWYRSKHLNRAEIEGVRDYLPIIGAGRWLPDNQQELTQWGVEQLPKWRQGVFTDIIELSRTPPTPEDG